MKATELEINDWVESSNGYTQVVALDVLGGDSIVTLRPFQSNPDIFTENAYGKSKGFSSIADLNPIPLTKKIMEENHICLDSVQQNPHLPNEWRVWVESLTNYTTIVVAKIIPSDNGDVEYDYVNELTFEGMPHVHELQHALRLFGLNELADNLVIEK